MDEQRTLIILIIALALTLAVFAGLFLHHVGTAREAISDDRAREAPSVGGKISVTVLNTTEGKNATDP